MNQHSFGRLDENSDRTVIVTIVFTVKFLVISFCLCYNLEKRDINITFLFVLKLAFI